MGKIYDIANHSHRFAAWAAATGASASPKCRFTVAQGKAILEEAGFTASLRKPSQLPSPARMDDAHKKWRERVIIAARRRKLRFSHGVAAKLINIYLKSRFTLGGHEKHPNGAALHPPIDSLLLKAVKRNNVCSAKLRTNWSTFDSETYQQIIERLRGMQAGLPFWTIEADWAGHQ